MRQENPREGYQLARLAKFPAPAILTRIKNLSGADVGRYGILAIGDSPSSAWPADTSHYPGNALTFESKSAVVSKDNCGEFAICPNGIKSGDTGPCWISGDHHALVYISGVADIWCDVCDGTSSYLLSRSSGSCQILTQATGSTGNQWCIIRMGNDQPFYAKITGHAVIGSNLAWSYAFSEVFKNSAAQGGWSTLTNGRTGTTTSKILYNTDEDGNGSTGTFMNGVTSANLTGTLKLQPFPNNTIILVKKVWVGATPTLEYHFQLASGVDGGC